MKHSENKRMFDRMRARRGRIMKRLDAKKPTSGNPRFRGLHSMARDSAHQAQGGKTGRVIDLTMILYLTLFFLPFVIVILGILEYKNRY